jgi:hypothetical protein
MKQPEVGSTWWWQGFEKWRVVNVGSCADEFGEKDRMFVTVLCHESNQLRTVWTLSFYKRWKSKSKYD